MEAHPDFICSFCGGPCRPCYRMNRYQILRCARCGTGSVSPVPSRETLRAFYDGFLPNLTPHRYPRILAAGRGLFPAFGASRERRQRLLDVGGGGGFFSKAFEELGFGESTYVDLDPQSCAFARDELGLSRVICGDALELADADGFDIVYCRHLVEHLADPVTFLERSLGLLAPGGRLVVQVPNGSSLEYFSMPGQLINGRFRKISADTGWRMRKILWMTVFRGMILHGIDPPRHLWAMTRSGLEEWARRNGVACSVRCYSLWNLSYSPHFVADTMEKRLQGFIGRFLLAPIRGGTHLVAILGSG